MPIIKISVLVSVLLFLGCSILTYNYPYGDYVYQMRIPQYMYHEKVMKQVKSISRDTEYQKLVDQCKMLDEAIKNAPKPQENDNYTTAVGLLWDDRDSICEQAKHERNARIGLGGECPESTKVVRLPSFELCMNHNGNKHGWFISFHDRRSVKEKGKNGADDLYSNSNTSKNSTGQYLNGKKTGEWEYWYRNGIRRSTGKYTNDKKTGIWRSWNKEGIELLEEYY